MQIKWWLEWIPPKSNPSDGLSRDGAKDELSRIQSWDVECLVLPPCLQEHSIEMGLTSLL